MISNLFPNEWKTNRYRNRLHEAFSSNEHLRIRRETASKIETVLFALKEGRSLIIFR